MYGVRGSAPCVSCMGLGLLKESKFLKVCFKLKSIVISDKTGRTKFETLTKLV